MICFVLTAVAVAAICLAKIVPMEADMVTHIFPNWNILYSTRHQLLSQFACFTFANSQYAPLLRTFPKEQTVSREGIQAADARSQQARREI
jgi:hypothetical protein